MPTQPTIVLIPGSFCFKEAYDPVVEPLRAKGYDIYVLEPPCYPAAYKPGSGAAPSMYDDARFVREFVGKLVDGGKEVVIVAHSYGGCPSTESLKGVTKEEREQLGKSGGVVRIAYLTAVVPRLGENCGQTLGSREGAPVEVGEDGWLSQPDPATTAAVCCNNLAPEAGTAQVRKMGKHFGPCFGDVLTHAGYKDVPVSWFFAAEDMLVVPEVQQTAIETIEKSWVGTKREGRKVDVTRVDCDHFPLVLAEKIDQVTGWIGGVVAKGSQE